MLTNVLFSFPFLVISELRWLRLWPLFKITVQDCCRCPRSPLRLCRRKQTSVSLFLQPWIKHCITPFQRHLIIFSVDTIHLSTKNVIKCLWKGDIWCSSRCCRNREQVGGIKVEPNKLLGFCSSSCQRSETNNLLFSKSQQPHLQHLPTLCQNGVVRCWSWDCWNFENSKLLICDRRQRLL